MYSTVTAILWKVHICISFCGSELFNRTLQSSWVLSPPWTIYYAEIICSHIASTVYSQVLFYTAEWTGAMWSELNYTFQNGTTGAFKPFDYLQLETHGCQTLGAIVLLSFRGLSNILHVALSQFTWWFRQVPGCKHWWIQVNAILIACPNAPQTDRLDSQAKMSAEGWNCCDLTQVTNVYCERTISLDYVTSVYM